MKMIFLHGLGQDIHSWNPVREHFADFETEAWDIFPRGIVNYQDAKASLLEHLHSQTEPFILIGLSLGGLLALDLSDQDLSQLKGLILSGTQYKLSNNFLYKLQINIFKLLPRRIFQKHETDKEQMIQILEELKTIDLTKKASNCNLPSLILCGNKDKPNLQAAKELHQLIRHSRITILPHGGHTLNTDQPHAFANLIRSFLEEIGNTPL